MDTIAKHKEDIDGTLEAADLKPLPEYMAPTFNDFNNLQSLMDDPAFICSSEHQELVKTIDNSAIIHIILQLLRIPVTERFREYHCGTETKSFVERIVERQSKPIKIPQKGPTGVNGVKNEVKNEGATGTNGVENGVKNEGATGTNGVENEVNQVKGATGVNEVENGVVNEVENGVENKVENEVKGATGQMQPMMYPPMYQPMMYPPQQMYPPQMYPPQMYPPQMQPMQPQPMQPVQPSVEQPGPPEQKGGNRARKLRRSYST